MTIHIPSSARRESAPSTDSLAARPFPTGISVLLVEDDAAVRAIMRRFLYTLGCKVSEAASAEHAMVVLAAEETDLELVVTDIVLGAGMHGTGLAAEARRQFPEMAVLLMSGYSAELVKADLESTIDWELLRKSCTFEELAQAVSRAVDR